MTYTKKTLFWLTYVNEVVLNAGVMQKKPPNPLYNKLRSTIAKPKGAFKADWKHLVSEIEAAGFAVHHPAVPTIAELMDHDLQQLQAKAEDKTTYNINWLAMITGINRTTISMWRLRNSIPRTRVNTLIDLFGKSSAFYGAFASGLLSTLEEHAIRIDRLRKIEDADLRKEAIRDAFTQRDEAIARVNAEGLEAKGQVGQVAVKTVGDKIKEVGASIRATSSMRARAEVVVSEEDQAYYEALEKKRQITEADVKEAKAYVEAHYKGSKWSFNRFFRDELIKHQEELGLPRNHEHIVYFYDDGDFVTDAFRVEVVENNRGLTLGMKARVHSHFYKAVLDIMHRIRRDQRLEGASIVFIIPETDSEAEQEMSRKYVEELRRRYLEPLRIDSEIRPSWLALTRAWVDGANQMLDEEEEIHRRIAADEALGIDPWADAEGPEF